MEQEAWKEAHVSITVEADHNFHDQTNKYKREDLKVDSILSISGFDGSESFSTVKIKALDEQSLTFTYGIYEYTLNKEKRWIKLGTSGRNYATFELYVSIEF